MNTFNTLLDLDSKHIKSYATKENLLTAMVNANVHDVRHLIVRTPSGRWTCVLIGFYQQHLGKFAMVS